MTLAHICRVIENSKEFQKNVYFCFTDYTKAFDSVHHNKLRKILKVMGTPDHLTASWETCVQVKKQQNQTWNNKLVPNQGKNMETGNRVLFTELKNGLGKLSNTHPGKVYFKGYRYKPLSMDTEREWTASKGRDYRSFISLLVFVCLFLVGLWL